MRTLFKRWWFWAGVVLLLGLTGTGAIFVLVGGSRINQANFDRIQTGMAEEELLAILGPATGEDDSNSETIIAANETEPQRTIPGGLMQRWWIDGPNRIDVLCGSGKVLIKSGKVYTVWETAKWHCGQGLKKLGL
jgi:hypothetical protein